jgi:hypothetical protein
VVLDSDELTRLIDIVREIEQRARATTTATPAKARLVRYAVKVPSEANSGA